MSYAVRKDGQGWRSVNSLDDVGPDETYSDTQPPINAPSANSLILAQIDQIERDTQMNRAVREGMLMLIEREAMREFNTDLPTAQAGLYVGNAAYKKVKDIDNQIVALRAQLT